MNDVDALPENLFLFSQLIESTYLVHVPDLLLDDFNDVVHVRFVDL